MNFELRYSFSLESARFLPLLPQEHPCRRMHGHSFQITLVWEGAPDPKTGWVIDYHWVDQKLLPLKQQLDHKVLNEIPGLENPTSELLCYFIFNQVKSWLPSLKQVIVKETSNTECRYPALD